MAIMSASIVDPKDESNLIDIFYKSGKWQAFKPEFRKIKSPKDLIEIYKKDFTVYTYEIKYGYTFTGKLFKFKDVYKNYLKNKNDKIICIFILDNGVLKLVTTKAKYPEEIENYTSYDSKFCYAPLLFTNDEFLNYD